MSLSCIQFAAVLGSLLPRSPIELLDHVVTVSCFCHASTDRSSSLHALCPMQSTEPLVHRNTVLGSSGTLPRSLSTPCSRDLRSYIARTRNKTVRAGDQSRGLGRVSMCARSGLSDVSSTRRCEASTVQRAVSFTPRFANHCCFCCCCV